MKIDKLKVKEETKRIRYFDSFLPLKMNEIWEFIDKNKSTMPPDIHGQYKIKQIKKWYNSITGDNIV